jgi:hypothetical protein
MRITLLHKLFLVGGLAFILISCDADIRDVFSQKKKASNTYPVKSYLDVAWVVEKHLPSNPYILEFKKGKKQIVFCGVEHLTDATDTENPMFLGIEQKFFEVKPNVCINEGGDVSLRKYDSKYRAVLQDGEIGLIKMLSDSLKIKTINGDPSIEYELNELVKKYPRNEVIAYIATERLMWQIHDQAITDTSKIRQAYNKFVSNYLIKKGKLELRGIETDFVFYKVAYEKLVGRAWSMDDLKPTNPFDADSKFQAIGRHSKEIRDQFLLKQIDWLLKKHDRVFIVFGGWHLLTCEPGLKQIIENAK